MRPNSTQGLHPGHDPSEGLVTQLLHIAQVNDVEALRTQLERGGSVEAYVGSRVRLFPRQRLDRPFRTDPQSAAERAVEAVRAAEFPNIRPRDGSLFIAPSPLEASKYARLPEGGIYRVCLRAVAGTTVSVASMSWLHREPFERLVNGQMIFNDALDAPEQLRPLAREYLSSRGEHTVSEILIDPSAIEVTVLGEHEPDCDQRLAELITSMFTRDECNSPPNSCEDIIERVDDLSAENLLFNIPKEKVLTACLVRFIELELEKGDSVWDAWDLSVTELFAEPVGFYAIQAALEKLQTLDFPMESRQALESRISCVREYCTAQASRLYLSKVRELAEGSSEIATYHENERRYFLACRLAQLEPEGEEVSRLRTLVGERFMNSLESRIKACFEGRHVFMNTLLPVLKGLLILHEWGTLRLEGSQVDRIQAGLARALPSTDTRDFAVAWREKMLSDWDRLVEGLASL